MKYAAAFNDDRAHRQQEDQRYVGWQTVCGQQVASTVKPDGCRCTRQTHKRMFAVSYHEQGKRSAGGAAPTAHRPAEP